MPEQNPDPKATQSAASKAARRYPESFKADAVRLVTHERYTFAQAAKAVGVSEKSLRDWHQRLASPAGAEAHAGADEAMTAENRRLREALRQAEMERDILKKAAVFFANDTSDGSPSSRSKR